MFSWWFFLVVTSYDVLDFCWWSSLPFRVLPISCPLFKVCLWSSKCLSCSILLVDVSLCLLLFSKEKLGVFGVELYGEIYLYSTFLLIFKIMRFGVMCCVTGLDGSFGRVFLILSMWPLTLDKSILVKLLLAIYWDGERGLCSYLLVSHGLGEIWICGYQMASIRFVSAEYVDNRKPQGFPFDQICTFFSEQWLWS